MSKLITASIDVMKINNSMLITGKKGTYLNLTIWVNDKDDQFGNDVSIEQRTEKGADKIYLGNGKTYKPKSEQPPQAKDEFQGSAAKEAIINKAKEMDFNDDGMPF
jgi:hypothetical protein